MNEYLIFKMIDVDGIYQERKFLDIYGDFTEYSKNTVVFNHTQACAIVNMGDGSYTYIEKKVAV